MKQLDFDAGTPSTEYVIEPGSLRAIPVNAEAMAGCAAALEIEAFAADSAAVAADKASNAAILFAMLDQLERAERLAGFALERLPEQGAAKDRTVTEIRLAQVLQRQGRLGEAMTLLEAIVEPCSCTSPLHFLQDFALQHLGKVQLDAGLPAKAIVSLRAALALRQSKGDPDLTASTRQALAAARLALRRMM